MNAESDIATTEESPRDSGIEGFFEKYAPPAAPQPDLIQGRFALDRGKSLAHLSGESAKALAVRDLKGDGKSYFALICTKETPSRIHYVPSWKTFKSKSLPQLITAEPVMLGDQKSERLAFVYEEPQGVSLAKMIETRAGKPLPERTIVHDILRPIGEALQELLEAKIVHGRLNTHTVMVKDTIVIGDCLAEPCGLSQSYLYEPVEQAMASPLGKGEANSTIDCFAVATIALELLIGKHPLTQLTREQYVELLLTKGTYNAMVGTREIPEQLRDLLRGSFNDNPNERWETRQLLQWLDGKRYNLIHPSSPRDGSRPFPFEGVDFNSLRALAHGFLRQREQAVAAMRDNRLGKWLELSVQKAALAAEVKRTVSATGGTTSHNPNEDEELALRVAMALDPIAPLRPQEFTAHCDGLGPILAQAFAKNDSRTIDRVRYLILNDIPHYWSEFQDHDLEPTLTTMLWKLRKLRNTIKIPSFGFGMERCLYDLNPTLPCQSTQLGGRCVTTLEEMLNALESLAKENYKLRDPVDRHCAAFLASKLDLNKEVRFNELEFQPQLATSPLLIGARLLALAQSRTSNMKQRGLSAWIAHRLESFLKHIHSRSLRNSLATRLYKQATQGRIESLLEILIDHDRNRHDYDQYNKATNKYRSNNARIAALQDMKTLRDQANRAGLKIAEGIGYLVLATAVTVLFKSLPL